LGISVSKSTGEKLSYNDALARYGQVVWSGLALGFPIISLYTAMKARHKLVYEGGAAWDKELGLNVNVKKASFFGVLLCIAILLSVPVQVYEQTQTKYASEKLNKSLPTFLKQRTSIIKEYLANAQSILSDKLTPENLKTPSDVYALGLALQKEKTLLAKAEEAVETTYNDAEREINNLDVSRSYREQTLLAFREQKRKGQALIAELFSNEKASIEQLVALYNLLRINTGQYGVQNGQFVFASEDVLTNYNQIEKRLSEIHQNQQGVLDRLNGKQD
jgi:hypothetical protein